MDIRSIMIGLALGVSAVVIMGASPMPKNSPAGPAIGRYQLFNHQWWGGGAAPKVQDARHNNFYLSGVFKIDTVTGQVWALSAQNPGSNVVRGWTAIK